MELAMRKYWTTSFYDTDVRSNEISILKEGGEMGV